MITLLGAEVQSTQKQPKEENLGRTIVLNEEQVVQLALSEEVKAKEIVWLDVKYSDESDVVKVLSLVQKPRVSQVQGAVLLLHDKEQHADWPYLIRPLRMSLPDSGWYTLSVNLPYDKLRELPDRSISTKNVDQVIVSAALRQTIGATSSRALRKSSDLEEKKSTTDQPKGTEVPAESSQEDGDTQTDPVDIDLGEPEIKGLTVPIEIRANAHIKAALDHLKNVGYQNIIILAYRSAANLALEHIKDRAATIPAKGLALVLIDPILSAVYQEDLSAALGEGFKAPILDIVNKSDLDSRVLAAERAASARVAKTVSYMQVSLNANEANVMEGNVLRRIRFWLERYAPGMSARKVSSY